MADKFDFKKLTAKQIYTYMEANATAEQKKAFKAETFPVVGKKTSKKLFDADGKPIMYQVKDKDGNPKVDDNGNPVMRQKVEMVAVADSEAKPTFSLLKAKWWFAENFPDAVKNVPNKGNKEAPAGDLFANW